VRTTSETPASLLRLAGEARGRGDVESASALYRRLQREYGDTREAAVSSVPWGGILLRQGQAERALEQFDRYLKTEPRGNLLPEALYGRGRALAALGRGADEKQTWRRLLSEMPGSAYESHARRRLDELK
jgi:TolA-binding protein